MYSFMRYRCGSNVFCVSRPDFSGFMVVDLKELAKLMLVHYQHLGATVRWLSKESDQRFVKNVAKCSYQFPSNDVQRSAGEAISGSCASGRMMPVHILRSDGSPDGREPEWDDPALLRAHS